MKKSTNRKIAVIIVIICLLSVIYIAFSLLAPNKRMVPAFEGGKLNVIVGGSVAEAAVEPQITDGEILVPFEIIKKYIDDGIYWDKELEKVTVTTKNRVIRMKTGSLDAFVNNKPVTLNIPVKLEAGEVYIPIEFLSDFYDISIEFIKQNNVIVIDFLKDEKKVAEPIGKTVPVRNGSSVHDPIVEKVSTGGNENELRVFSENEKWYGVRTANGAIGFVEKKLVTVKTIPADLPKVAEDAADVWKPLKGKINMVWDYTWGGRPDLDKRPRIEGLDVISPTSFQVVSEDGTIKNRSDAKYIEWAHNNGYKVWALCSNNFGDEGSAGDFLRDTDARDNAIKQLLAFSALYKFDGVNFDFEELPDSDRDVLTQFIKEASVLLREQGLVVSADINSKGCYDRQALAECTDYIAVMAYDQHWSGGKEAGSVAEIPWTESMIKTYLKTIPAEKLILGIPFYTRLWKEEKAADGSISITSQALSMESARKLVEESASEIVWDEESEQFYTEFVKDGAVCRLWLEDSNSVDIRSSLVLKYQIAGVAAWRKGYETADIWEAINRNLKTINAYSDWQNITKSLNRVYSR